MTNDEFIAKYKKLITVHFNFDRLVDNTSITIKKNNKQSSEFLEFYIPRYTKNGRWDDRPIERIIPDNDTEIVRLKDIIAAPAEWDLEPFPNAAALSEALWPIPIATDSQSGKTLVLDSNHTICSLLTAGINMIVPCVELCGENLSDLGSDLKLMRA